LAKVPIRDVNAGGGSGRHTHDRTVSLVESRLKLQDQLAKARSAGERVIVARQIAATDAEIDRLVYELYGLTPEEIAIVEAAGR
jgi:hypothetical protein